MPNPPIRQLQQCSRRIAELKADFPQDPEATRTVAVEIGTLVREIREQAGWNIRRLAKVADTNMRVIHNLENGRRLPNVALLEAFLYAFTKDERAPFKQEQ